MRTQKCRPRAALQKIQVSQEKKGNPEQNKRSGGKEEKNRTTLLNNGMRKGGVKSGLWNTSGVLRGGGGGCHDVSSERLWYGEYVRGGR